MFNYENLTYIRLLLHEEPFYNIITSNYSSTKHTTNRFIFCVLPPSLLISLICGVGSTIINKQNY